MTVKRCDIILPTCDQLGLLKDCISSLIAHTRYPFRVIVINNGKSDDAAAYLNELVDSRKLDIVVIKPEENLGWIRSINKGLELSKDSEYVSFQNDDTVFTESWLEEVVSVFESDPQIGIVNPEWERPKDADIDKFAAVLKQKYAGRTVDMDWCRGHCFVVKREVVNKIGGFDPVYIPVYYDDRDYSLKAIEAGYRCVKARGAFVEHVRNVTMKSTMHQNRISDLMNRNGKIFYKRWGYPLRIVFALKHPASHNQLLKKMCMDQNKVIILASGDKEASRGLYEHTNLKAICFNALFYNISSLIYLLSNRSTKPQKKTDFIFTDDERLYNYLRLFAKFLPAKIVFSNDVASLNDMASKIVEEKKNCDKQMIGG